MATTLAAAVIGFARLLRPPPGASSAGSPSPLATVSAKSRRNVPCATEPLAGQPSQSGASGLWPASSWRLQKTSLMSVSIFKHAPHFECWRLLPRHGAGFHIRTGSRGSVAPRCDLNCILQGQAAPARGGISARRVRGGGSAAAARDARCGGHARMMHDRTFLDYSRGVLSILYFSHNLRLMDAAPRPIELGNF